MSEPTLKLTAPFERETCPTCRGAKTVPCPRTFSTRTQSWHQGERVPQRQPGEGHPIPCPDCNGKGFKVWPPEKAPAPIDWPSEPKPRPAA